MVIYVWSFIHLRMRKYFCWFSYQYAHILDFSRFWLTFSPDFLFEIMERVSIKMYGFYHHIVEILITLLSYIRLYHKHKFEETIPNVNWNQNRKIDEAISSSRLSPPRLMVYNTYNIALKLWHGDHYIISNTILENI